MPADPLHLIPPGKDQPEPHYTRSPQAGWIITYHLYRDHPGWGELKIDQPGLDDARATAARMLSPDNPAEGYDRQISAEPIPWPDDSTSLLGRARLRTGEAQ